MKTSIQKDTAKIQFANDKGSNLVTIQEMFKILEWVQR